jgi:hypothetical protein
MPSVTVKIYRALEPNHKRELAPDALLKVLSVAIESEKPLNKERAKRLLSRIFPDLGKVWYVFEHEYGWQRLINYRGAKAWALVCRQESK